ncbi:MAG: hypothetical protein AB7U73_09065 [Pirellulales bacterium]
MGLARQQQTLQQGAQRSQMAGGPARFGMSSLNTQVWRANQEAPHVARGGQIPSYYRMRATGHAPRFMDSAYYFFRGPE